jgi:2-oxoglutarate ferredoxin oxidoreductase subunit alpha
MAASTTFECFSLTIKAFNLSEKYRTPVILLLDEVVAHTREKIHLPPLDEVEVLDRIRPNMPYEWYVPYEDNTRGVPLMSMFGDGYRYHVTGLIHDVRGFPTQRPEEIRAFQDRIHRKIRQHFQDIQTVYTEEVEDAEVLVIAYGSVARSARRAVREARKQGIRAGLLQLVTLWPFPRREVEFLLRKVRAVLVPELNMGQVAREVKRVNQGICTVETLRRIDGKLISPNEILARLLKI